MVTEYLCSSIQLYEVVGMVVNISTTIKLYKTFLHVKRMAHLFNCSIYRERERQTILLNEANCKLRSFIQQRRVIRTIFCFILITEK